MKHRYILSTDRPGAEHWWDGVINHPEQGEIAITKTYKVKPLESVRHDEILRVKFSDKKLTYVIQYDDALFHKISSEEDKKNAIDLIKLQHKTQLADAPRNPYLKGAPLFKLEYVSNQAKVKVDETKEKWQAYTKFQEMTLDEKLECGYFYGQNPSGLKLSEFVYQMTDFGTGWLMRNEKMSDEPEAYSYRYHFLNLYGINNTPEQRIQSAVKKAIASKAIDKRPDGYYYGEAHVGNDDTQLYAFFRDNDSMYGSLLNKVKNSCRIENDMDEKPKEPKKVDPEKRAEGDPVEAAIFEDKLRNLCRENKIPAWKNMFVETMKKKLDEAGIDWKA